MGKPAARVTDLHVCPMVTPMLPPIPHVGGPIIGPGCATVLIGGMPAALMGDMCICVGPPDSIVLGSSGVFIGGKPAARVGDSCAHGGVILLGCPTVLIGEAAVVAPDGLEMELVESEESEGDLQEEQTDHFADEDHGEGEDIPIIPDNPRPAVSKSSIAFTLQHKDGTPIAGENFEVTLPDGSTRTGKTDNNGEVLIKGFDAGLCKVSFPDIHADEWS